MLQIFFYIFLVLFFLRYVISTTKTTNIQTSYQKITKNIYLQLQHMLFFDHILFI